MWLPLGNYVSINADAERREMGNDEVNDVLLVEADGVTVRADLIVVGGGQAISSTSMPAMPPSTIER